MSYAEMALRNNDPKVFGYLGPYIFVSDIHSQYGEALVFSALTETFENRVLLFSACGSIIGVDIENAYLVTFLTRREHEDVLAGVLDIGWLYRNSPSLLVECGAVFSIGDQVTIGKAFSIPGPLMLAEIQASVLPSRDFFLRPFEETKEETKVVLSKANYPKCLTCGHRTLTHTRMWPYATCSNNKKLHDHDDLGPYEGEDHLLYQYTESGAFLPEDNFGCIHHTDLGVNPEENENV